MVSEINYLFIHLFFNFFFFNVIGVYLIYNVLVSGVQHSEVKFLELTFV